MNKITVDRALIEQAVGALETPDGLDEYNRSISDVSIDALRAALAEPAVEPVVWHLSSNGLPPVGAQVIGGHFYVDPWLKDKTPVFSWGLCRVLETTHPEFKCGKQWHTFGPSHNDITHWCWPPAPPSNGNTSPPAEPAAEPVKGLFVDLIAQHPGLAEELAAIVIDAPQPLAEPARTSQDVCTVPLLSDEEVAQCIKDASKGSAINRDGSTSQRIVRSAEQLVRRKAGL